ncbi:MAG TPA: sugar phosphate nucleotidyltransferase [Pedobacter sp.]|uniref:sugar phosphate nucleotidyltransferase n=1 Tax=Pedobacter sp. TaxID=1411316 RepID=UPI002C8CDE34|nr:sugar phosphate nucleotidyltransferase [Pedobacter sp.]HMI01434.1 sugar phosphate nucleotidyltransferase [Pedobacter sp.]
MTSEAIVLAGGLGTRLQEVVKDIPKPMVDINGRVFLDYILFLLAKGGIKRVILAVGYKHLVIEEFLQDPAKTYGMEICYSVEDEPLGTGGAIFQAFGQVQGDAAFVINGDTYFDVPLADLEDFAASRSADLAFALKIVENSSRYGTVNASAAGQILSFDEKVSGSDKQAMISGGIYYMKKSLISARAKPAKFSVEQDFFQKDLEYLNAYGKVYKGIFIDIGIPEDYELAQTLLKNI